MRLIDADALLEKYSIPFPVYNEEDEEILEIPLVPPGYVRGAPTIDAVPAVHSYWIGLALGPHPGIGFGICGNCHQRITLGDHKSRCPNCGAIMDMEAPGEA